MGVIESGDANWFYSPGFAGASAAIAGLFAFLSAQRQAKATENSQRIAAQAAVESTKRLQKQQRESLIREVSGLLFAAFRECKSLAEVLSMRDKDQEVKYDRTSFLANCCLITVRCNQKDVADCLTDIEYRKLMYAYYECQFELLGEKIGVTQRSEDIVLSLTNLAVKLANALLVVAPLGEWDLGDRSLKNLQGTIFSSDIWQNNYEGNSKA